MTTEVTMKKLSQISGYSISTISKALKDKRDVSVETKNKIKKLAHSYNYVPNNTAIALRSRKTNTIAVIVPKIDCMVYSSMLHSIQEVAFKQGYRVLIQQYLTCENGEFECLNRLRDGGVDGVILICTSNAKESFYFNDVSKLSAINLFPTVIKKVEDLTLKAQEYRSIGNKIVKSLFTKIDSLRENSILEAIY